MFVFIAAIVSIVAMFVAVIFLKLSKNNAPVISNVKSDGNAHLVTYGDGTTRLTRCVATHCAHQH